MPCAYFAPAAVELGKRLVFQGAKRIALSLGVSSAAVGTGVVIEDFSEGLHQLPEDIFEPLGNGNPLEDFPTGVISDTELHAGGLTLVTDVQQGEVTITMSSSGSYTIEFPDGKRYHGKGSIDRAKTSAREKMKQYGYNDADIDWAPADSDRDAFKDEDDRIQSDDGVENENNLNKINSPGKRYKEEDAN